MKRYLLPIFVCMVIVLALHTDTIQSQNNIPSNYGNDFNRYLSGLQLPNELYLCGEKIPLEEPEVRERAEREFYLLLQKPGQVILYLKRAGRFFPMYERILAEQGLPDDLKYLSVAESALFQSTSSVGAMGLWQFMKRTGRDEGLIVNDNVDERRNPEKSTIAAAKFLKKGYKRTNSWLLTLGGYNMGFSGISKRVKQQFGSDYFDLHLNSETSRFVFRVAIIKELMANADKYGYSIPDWQLYKPYKTKTVSFDKGVSNLSEWAISNGTTYKYVRLYNPWILKGSLPAPPKGKTWEILIPDE